MNYKRIYDEFIADRKEKQPNKPDYYETHHIVPRCIGGDDTHENLIRLTAEDHFFAHLLLAKIHNTRQAWGACVLMSKSRWHSQIIRSRKIYGLIRRAWSLASRGHNSSNHDSTVYTFYNLDGKEFTGTRVQFCDAFNLNRVNINSLVRGGTFVTSDWCMRKVSRDEFVEIKRKRCAKAASVGKGVVKDNTYYSFRRIETGDIIRARQYDMVTQYGVTKADACDLVRNRGNRKGWCLVNDNDNTPL